MISQRSRRLLFALPLLLVVLLASCFAGRHDLVRRHNDLPPFTHRAAASETQWMTLRDGVRLVAEVYRPKGLDKAPTVLIRNPYELLAPILRTHCGVLARYGYACVLQSVRGRAGSEGEWTPVINERNDGIDTVNWLVQQPWVDGNVAMMGPSYLGWTQWAIADSLPPEVKTLMPAVYGLDVYTQVYERGLFRHDVITAWATLMPNGESNLFGDDAYLAAARHMPPIEADEAEIGAHLDWYRTWLNAPGPADPYWANPPVSQVMEIADRTQVPVFMVAGFFDPFFASQLKTFQRLGSRDQSVLLIGPWNHLGQASGDLDMPLATGGLDQWALTLEWLDHTLRGAPLRNIQAGEVRSLAPNDTQWRRRPDWPPQNQPLTLHLGDAQASQSCAGGALGAQPAPRSSIDYVFDPADPNPTRGGASLLSFLFYRRVGPTPGPVDQGESCARDDVLSFRGEALTEALHLAGTAHLTLTVRSSAPDTSFVARLINEQPEGAVLVREAAATLAWPTSEPLPAQPYIPGEERTIVLDFWPIEWVAPKGSRLRVDLSSSSFPALAVHSNRAGPWAEQTGFDVATQTVLVGEGSGVLELAVQAP